MSVFLFCCLNDCLFIIITTRKSVREEAKEQGNQIACLSVFWLLLFCWSVCCSVSLFLCLVHHHKEEKESVREEAKEQGLFVCLFILLFE